MASDHTPFTVRLLDAREDLEFGAEITGETRAEFTRRAIRERTEREERRHLNTLQEDDGDGRN